MSIIPDGASIMIGGFGPAGQPLELIDALIERGARELTVISNNAGNGDSGLAALLKTGCVRKMICSFPRQADSWVFDDLYRRGAIELELVPQGNRRPACRPPAAGWAAFSPQPPLARRWRKAKKRVKSTGVITCLKRP